MLEYYFLVASINMALVQCSTSSDWDGGGGKVGCSIISQSSATRLSDFPYSAISGV